MKPLGALLLGTAAYGVFLVATVPATWIAGRVAGATQGQVIPANAEGTLWNGSARADVRLPATAFAIDDMRWRFLPSRLLAGRIAFAIEARVAGLQGNFEAARGPLAWSVRDLKAAGDAAALARIFPLAAAWQPAGAIAVEAEQLSWDGRQVSGAATAEWRDAALSLSAARPLGSWRAQANAEGGAFKITLATAKGPLRLSGNGTLPMQGRFTFAGEARAEAGRERELEALLDLLGSRRADGARAFELR
jgi:general secretion pathway protein N